MKNYSFLTTTTVMATALGALGMTAALHACGTGIGGGSGAASGAKNSKWVSPSGVIYVADTGNHRIRRVLDGTINTVAGTTQSFSGDGGPATSSQLSSPMSVVADDAGNFYIADQQNTRIRKVSGGVISTAAGTGNFGLSGDGGAATAAELSDPAGIAMDSSGNIYFADTNNQVVRKVTVATGIITTVAGNSSQVPGYSGDGGPATSAELNNPKSVAIDSVGNLFIADASSNVIRRVDASTGKITTVAGNQAAGWGFSGDGGLATSAKLNGPVDVVVDNQGIIYIADAGNNRIRKVDLAGKISTIAGTGIADYTGDGGPAVDATFKYPCAVALDRVGNLFIVDRENHSVRKIDLTGTISTVAGNGFQGGTSGDGGPATSATFLYPFNY